MARRGPGIGLRTSTKPRHPAATEPVSAAASGAAAARRQTQRDHQGGSAEQRRDLPDMQNAKSIGNRVKRLAHEKKNECKDNAVARASTESSLANTGSSARANRLAANVARAMRLRAGGSGEFTSSFS
jgi:hypothetical protein